VDTDKVLCVHTTSAIAFSVDTPLGDITSAKPYLVMSYTWQDLADQFLDFSYKSVGELVSTDFIIALVTFSGANVNGFDYTYTPSPPVYDETTNVFDFRRANVSFSTDLGISGSVTSSEFFEGSGIINHSNLYNRSNIYNSGSVYNSGILYNSGSIQNAGTLTNVGNITCSGTVTAVTLNATSSREWKTDIKPFEQSALDIITNTDVCSYKFKHQLEEDKVGVIAEDVHDLISPSHKSVDIGNTLGLIMKAIQELNAKIECLK
jgi:hypothetical protein